MFKSNQGMEDRVMQRDISATVFAITAEEQSGTTAPSADSVLSGTVNLSA